jgi:hypothetical protein
MLPEHSTASLRGPPFLRGFMMATTVEQYIDNLILALKANQNARMFYFPPNKRDRKEKNLRLAREIGYGLKDFADGHEIVTSLYGKIIVIFSFDTTGVCIDAKEFFSEIRNIMTQ